MLSNPWAIALDSKGNYMSLTQATIVSRNGSGKWRRKTRLSPTIMAFQWTHPHWLWLGLVAIPWMVWWHMRTDHVMAKWKRHLILALRLIITLLILLGLAGLQWLRPMEGLNVVYLLDRSESLSADQKQQALSYVQRTMPKMKPGDHAGVVVFGEEAALELRVLPQNALPQIQSVLNTSRTDLEAAIRLGTAAFPESGQKRIILLSDGNENLGDGLAPCGQHFHGCQHGCLPDGIHGWWRSFHSANRASSSSRRQPNLRFRCLRNPMRPNPQH